MIKSPMLYTHHRPLAVMVSILLANQNSYLATHGVEPTMAAAASFSVVFTISFVLALVNIALSFFIKKPK
ncbi:hypothetical protein [Neobacillus terrae]|uniref:hypothetical protein n=1 Tax=Neobacillus terrae TaxID=3034837 RepID=UPI00140B0F90|nr:hypothetical protein [Neobacillus terrae]NHM33453.1 hypothetical protein [Neobacillus terrae]